MYLKNAFYALFIKDLSFLLSLRRGIGLFCVAPSLCFKARLSTKLLSHMKMIFYFHANKSHVYKKRFAFSLILKVRVLELKIAYWYCRW